VLILDGRLYLHHKDKSKRLFLEVDACDVGWGADERALVRIARGRRKDESMGHRRKTHNHVDQQRMDDT
jgi:hypothetical protein